MAEARVIEDNQEHPRELVDYTSDCPDPDEGVA
jgi:hypothetical protein